ncbi:MAG: DUF3108 domain-containing protein [Ignavibacteriaceae bacterium]|nr:DUF3108 domain-containing protein [Ignavibacteriaceae bacterium]
MKKIIGLLILFPAVFLLLTAFRSEPDAPGKYLGNVPVSSGRFIEGEELYYRVSYLNFTIGELFFKIYSKKNENGRPLYYAKVFMNSNPAIPFVKLNQIYESTFGEPVYSEFFRGIVVTDEDSTFTDYDFNYRQKNVKFRQGSYRKNETWKDQVLPADTFMQDGLSIFYFARNNTGRDFSIRVPCFVNEKKVYTKINFYKKPEPVETETLDYEVSCTRVDGLIEFKSVYGLTGEYEGWFSNDEAAIPVKAELNVILGSVKVELSKWKRPGWSPPKWKK